MASGASLDELRKENEKLKNQLDEFKKRVESLQEQHSALPLPETLTEKIDDLLTIVVFGASGDLAKKKTYPAIYSLYILNLLPKNVKILGFARSPMPDDEFRAFIGKGLKDHEKKESFLQLCSYFVGKYDADESYKSLNDKISKSEGKTGNRIYYMAIPPSIFYAVAKGIRHFSMSSTGWNRVIVEKPFGRDLDSFEELSKNMSGLFSEDELYRIDHYLGKEMVQNLMALRFANQVFEPLWNRFFIKNVQITFKEDIGTEGRGGYFDQFGIIRDVMQNHLLQIFSLVAMEPPFSLSAEDVRDEKVKLLRYVPPIRLEETVIGQYTASPDGSTPGYLEDKSVPEGSVCPTFATCILHVENSRWSGVPFILKCGKGLNERKAEVRIQFTVPPNGLYKDAKANELVLRVQPNEAVYLKLGVKEPGLSDQLTHKELDLSYHDRFQSLKLPDAYERLIYDVVRGDHNLFVRGDELSAAWKIFTPLLHKLEGDKVKPIPYAFGSRGPAQSDELIQRFGFQRNEDYSWPSKI